MFISLCLFAFRTQQTYKFALQIILKHALYLRRVALYLYTEQLDFYYDTAHHNVVFRRYSDVRRINRKVLITDLSILNCLAILNSKFPSFTNEM